MVVGNRRLTGQSLAIPSHDVEEGDEENPEREGVPRSPLNLAYAAVAILIPLAWLVFTLRAPYARAVTQFYDDAFYYFRIAHNLALGHGSTFNGIDRTNGYQPLWLLLLVPEFGAFSGRSVLVAVQVLDGALFAVSVFLLNRIGSRLWRPPAMAIGTSVFVLFAAAGPQYVFGGMEAAVLLPSELAVVLIVARTGGWQAERVSARLSWALGSVLAVAVLARLDTVFLVAVVVGFALWRLRKVERAKLVRCSVGLIVPPLVTLVAYVSANEWLFGTATPVSGQAKALGGPFANAKPVVQFLEAPAFLGHSLWFGLLVLVTVPLALAVTRRGASETARGLAYAAAILLVAELVTLIYYSFASSWQLWPWYFSSTSIMLAITIAAVLDASQLANRLSTTVMTRTAIAALALTVVFVAGNLVRLDRQDSGRTAYIVNAVNRLNQSLPRNAVVAMGDRAGALGYFLDRPLVQLEGLVNSVQYLDALRQGSVHEFLRARRVSIYIRFSSDHDPGLATGMPGCTRFMEPQKGNGLKAPVVVCARDLLSDQHYGDGTHARIWRFREDLNP